MGGGDEGFQERRVGGDLRPVDGRGEGGARSDVAGDHDEAARERGSGEEPAGTPERRLQRGDERHERQAREEADEDGGHHAAAVVGEEARQLGRGGAGRREHALDEVGDDQEDRGREAAKARQPSCD